MNYEVELKFRRDADDGLGDRIRQLGTEPSAPRQQRDAYFAHPVRDFGNTDEGFRIRSEGENNHLTYKGPKVDEETKTRQEVEVAFAAGADARHQMAGMLSALGFREILTVTKQRRSCRLDWEDRPVELVLDTVEPLGQFVELETISPESGWQAARDSLKRLAVHLRLSVAERRSYLELLLEEIADAAQD